MSDYSIEDHIAYNIGFKAGQETQAARIAELEAECTRLRAACDAYFRTISLSQMRHGRILVGIERRNARQRRALAKMYQRRHDKNARIAELEAALKNLLSAINRSDCSIETTLQEARALVEKKDG
jgi:hypothetical protein